MIDMRKFLFIYFAGRAILHSGMLENLQKEKCNFDFKYPFFSFCRFKFRNLNINTKGENCMEFFQ